LKFREEIKIDEGKLKNRKKMDTTHKGMSKEFKSIIERANVIYNYDDESKYSQK